MENEIVWQDAWMSEVVCPHCNHIYDIGSTYQSFYGTAIRCSNCGNYYKIEVKIIFATSKDYL